MVSLDGARLYWSDFATELLHWKELTIAAGVAPIVDGQVTRLNNHVRTVAYRAFYPIKIQDPA